MIKVVRLGHNDKWDYDWRVLEHRNENSEFPPVYVCERNQGIHDARYFMCGGLFLRKDDAVEYALRTFGLKPQTDRRLTSGRKDKPCRK